MKAMILAAGFGTRLFPLTIDRTKPAIPFLGKPLVGYVAEYLAKFGFKDVVVNLHHQPDSVIKALGDGTEFGVTIHYTREEPKILGTAGALDNARHLLEDDPLSGYVFIFFNKPRDKIKLLVWDKDGYVLYQKRLSKGCFEELKSGEAMKSRITYDHLVMLISGISIRHLVQRKRYSALSTISA